MKQDQIHPLGITSAQVNALLRYNPMNIFSFGLTDGSTLKAATCIPRCIVYRPSIERTTCVELHSHFRFDELFTRLTMEPFAEKPIDSLTSISFVRTELKANRGVSGGVSHKFNAIRHDRETAEIVTVEKLQKSYAVSGSLTFSCWNVQYFKRPNYILNLWSIILTFLQYQSILYLTNS